MITQRIEPFADLDDPRCPGKVEHPLIAILVMAICAVLACAERWEAIALYGRSQLAWLRQFLALPNALPSHDPCRRGFMRIDPDAFEARFIAWVGTIATPGEQEGGAIDGQPGRRSFDRGPEQSPRHLVSAWASAQGLVLGQHRGDDKANELTAMPAWLESLALETTLVTVEAMGCQKAMAERMLERQADSRLVLKANQENDYAAVRSYFAQHGCGRGATTQPVWDAVDETPGRLVRRRVFARPPAAFLETLGDWPELHTVLAVEAIRGGNGSGKVEAEIRYLLSSSAGDPQLLAQASRRHGSIENSLPWVLDVTCREDDSRRRTPTAGRTLALLRKIAIH